MGSIIQIEDLHKSFGEVKAVDGISFSVEEGSLFAFLGINGAGKSTTINIICTLLNKDSGKVNVAGYDLDKHHNEIRRSIGVVFQGSILDKTLSVKDNLSIRAAYYGLVGEAWKDRLNSLTSLLELKEILSRPYGKLSGGQRRRVDIARGLIHTPKILILDEPTTGLDPQTRRAVWNVIDRLRRDTGMTVFLTTHYMEEANSADNVVIIDSGRIAAEGSPVGLKDRYSNNYIRLYTAANTKIDERLSRYEYKYDNNCYIIPICESEETKRFILNNSDIIDDFEVVKGDMDDVFLNVTGKNLLEA